MFGAVIRDINEKIVRDEGGGTPELTITLRDGDSIQGTVETFDMNGLIILKNMIGVRVYLSAEDVITVMRTT
jgi:small nuclear ribonucleoprotein (snRNP)-like protein